MAFLVLGFGGQGLIQVGGSEPPFSAPVADILSFFQTRDPLLFNIGGYLSVLGMLALIWFVGAVWARLRRFEENPGWVWRST